MTPRPVKARANNMPPQPCDAPGCFELAITRIMVNEKGQHLCGEHYAKASEFWDQAISGGEGSPQEKGK